MVFFYLWCIYRHCGGQSRPGPVCDVEWWDNYFNEVEGLWEETFVAQFQGSVVIWFYEPGNTAEDLNRPLPNLQLKPGFF